MNKPINLSGLQEDTLRGYLGQLVDSKDTPLADVYVLGSILNLLDPEQGFTCEHERTVCPKHGGAFDCTVFCDICEGTQEYCSQCDPYAHSQATIYKNLHREG